MTVELPDEQGVLLIGSKGDKLLYAKTRQQLDEYLSTDEGKEDVSELIEECMYRDIRSWKNEPASPASSPVPSFLPYQGPPPPPPAATPTGANDELVKALLESNKRQEEQNKLLLELIQRDAERAEDLKSVVQSNTLAREAEIKAARERETRRRQIEMPKEMSLPEYKDPYRPQSCKAAYFATAEFISEVLLAFAVKLSDQIKVAGEWRAAGEVYGQIVNGTALEQFEQSIDDPAFVFDVHEESSQLSQIERKGFADMAAWSLETLKNLVPSKVFGPKNLSNILDPGDLRSGADRNGPQTTGYILFRIYKTLYACQNDSQKWSAAVHGHTFLPTDNLEGFLVEVNKFKHLVEFAEKVGAHLDARLVVKVAMNNFDTAEQLCFYPVNFTDQKNQMQRECSKKQIKADDMTTARSLISSLAEWAATTAPRINKNPSAEPKKQLQPPDKTRSVRAPSQSEIQQSAESTAPGPSEVSTSRTRTRVARAPPDGNANCYFFLNGGCVKEGCQWKHDESKVPEGNCKLCNMPLAIHVDGACPKKRPGRADSDASSAASGTSGRSGGSTKSKGKKGKKGKGKSKGKGKQQGKGDDISPDDSVSQAQPARRCTEWRPAVAKDEIVKPARTYREALDEPRPLAEPPKQPEIVKEKEIDSRVVAHFPNYTFWDSVQDSSVTADVLPEETNTKNVMPRGNKKASRQEISRLVHEFRAAKATKETSSEGCVESTPATEPEISSE